MAQAAWIVPGIRAATQDQRVIFYRSGSSLYRVAIDSPNGFSACKPERSFAPNAGQPGGDQDGIGDAGERR